MKFKPIRRDPPAYPHEAMRSGAQATVYMRLVMNAEGDITESSGSAYPPGPDTKVLVRAARNATMGWKFAPEGLEGRGAILCFEFAFRLR